MVVDSSDSPSAMWREDWMDLMVVIGDVLDAVSDVGDGVKPCEIWSTAAARIRRRIMVIVLLFWMCYSALSVAVCEILSCILYRS
mmetsp:Transcript_24298/g.36962  ORF Transcript_24298/g.36962 Transcript_24298/m.36962 type:complete len:85 (+) Transcript_24298:533-787(+)